MNRAVRATATTLVLLVALPAGAQPGGPAVPEPAALRGESTQTRKRLAEAEQKIIGGKAADAADDLQRLLDESADDLITLDGHQFRAARWVAHALFAKLPPDVLKAYQDRIDQPAKKLLEQARQSRDPRPLWQLLDRYFVSRPADAGLLLLGELLFERGEFRAAEDVWRRLLPDAGADPAYPNSKADPALVRARIALAVIFQADAARAKAEVAAFKEKHPNATGTLAGKTGPLADTLQAHLAARPKLAADAISGAAWPTYGGAPDRAGRVPAGVPHAWPGRPSWAKDIPPMEKGFNRPKGPPARQPFGHPVIVNGEVFVTDGARVFGFDLHKKGEPTNTYHSELTLPENGHALEPIGSLTASGGLLYARLGVSTVRPPTPDKGMPDKGLESALVCLNSKLVMRWRLGPPEDTKGSAWEGAPLVSGRRLWAVYTKFEGGRAIHVATCYDPADALGDPGPPAWTTELCDSPVPVVSAERNRQELLTLAGRHLVFCSNSGAVVAVDALTGRRAWGFRYPRARKPAPGATSDPSPAVAFGGRVFVAPADGERVYALDAETGALVWQSGPTEGARILGVARGRLIVTVAGPVRGIRGLALDTGSYRAADGGWAHAAPLGYGQGLVTDDVIVWPSREGLYFLDARTGLPAPGTPNPRPGPVGEKFFGHIAYADGVLVVVTSDQVRGYVAQSMKIEPLPDLPPRERFDTLSDRAEREVAAGHPAKARAILAEVVASDLPAPLRAWAAARMLQLSPSATNASQLPAEVQAALRTPLLNEWVLDPAGVPVTLDSFLQRHLGRPPAPGSAPECPAPRPPESPTIAAEAEIEHTLKLPPAVTPLLPIPGAGPPKRLFAAGANVVVAVPLDQSKISEHLPTDLFTHAAEVRNWFVVAGPLAVAVYGTVREPLWVFRVPTDRLPDSDRTRVQGGGEPARPHLSSFVLVGPWLLARVGDHHLIALDLPARRVAWVLNSGGRAGYEPGQFPNAVRFGPHIAVCGRFVVVQLSDGRRWFVELVTGRPVVLPALGEHTARVWWPHAPADLGGNRLLVADGPGLARLLQLDGRVRWVYEVDRDDGLTGEPVQTWVRGSVLLVAVRRNHGVELERVNLADGKRAWSEDPTFANADRIDLSAADADADRAYVPAANKLLALTLSNGKVAWEAELPDAHSARGWVVRAGKSCVLVYPAEAVPAEPSGAVWNRLVRSFAREPFVWRLPGLAATLYDAWVARAVPVLLFDPETGKRLGRFDIPARGPAVTAWFDADRAVIATGDRVVWIK